MKLLITGASGFIGHHLIDHLEQAGELEVHALSRSAHKSRRNVHWHQADFFDEDKGLNCLKQIKPTHLLHLAWCTTPGQYWSSPENASWLDASVLMANTFFEQGGQRFIGAGSCAEYEGNDGMCREEDTHILPQSNYGASKAKLFAALEDLNKHGASCAWGRVFWTYGPGENSHRLVPYVINNLLKKEIAVCTGGTQIRDYLHVKDVAAAFKVLLDSDTRGAINIGSGNPIAIKDLVSLIGAKMGAPELLRFAPLSSDAQSHDTVCADVTRLAASGFRAQIDLPSGIEQTIKWWRDEAATQ
jgi:nucleoside-diphosphate-sugar epimerase